MNIFDLFKKKRLQKLMSMDDLYDLNRFVVAQEVSYSFALKELKNGRKTSHWIWYIFPQLKGLGRSFNSEFYGISGKEEASAYLQHPILNNRLREVCDTILDLETNDAREIFGGIDSRKLKSSMTLFDIVAPDEIFVEVLDKFFQGRRCKRTLKKLEN